MKTRTLLATGLMMVGFLCLSPIIQAKTLDFKQAIRKTVKYPAFANEK